MPNFEILKEVPESTLNDPLPTSEIVTVQKVKRTAIAARSEPTTSAKKKLHGYWNEEVIEKEAMDFFESRGAISFKLLKESGRNDLFLAIARKYPGSMYSLLAQLGIDHVVRPRTLWTVPLIEQAVANMIEENGEITLPALRQNRGLRDAISKLYPGRIKGIEDRFGVKLTRRSPLTVDEIEQEATVFIAEHGTINYSLLVENGLGYLAKAIRSTYPDKWWGLQRKLGIARTRAVRGQWTTNAIEEEALAFYQEHGVLSKSSLAEHGKNGLDIAISRKYPGGIISLREKMGIPPPQAMPKPNGYWTPERIEEEISQVYSQNGGISRNLLISLDRQDLIGAIEKYPGKMKGIRQFLRLHPFRAENGYWDNPENVYIELERIIVSIGHFPSQRELVERGKGTLSQAISKHGGTNYWRKRFNSPTLSKNGREIPSLDTDLADEQLRKLLEGARL